MKQQLIPSTSVKNNDFGANGRFAPTTITPMPKQMRLPKAVQAPLFKHDFSRVKLRPVQAKFKPNDKYGQKANLVGVKVMKVEEPVVPVQVQSQAKDNIQIAPFIIQREKDQESTRESQQEQPGSRGQSEQAQSGEQTLRQQPTPTHIAGQNPPSHPYRIIRLAWTLDDGPTNFTSVMRRTLGMRRGTWFIMRNSLGQGNTLQSNLENMRNLQNTQRNEFAIHSMHPNRSHGAWFPVRVGSGTPKIYDTMQEAMTHLSQFVTLLRRANINVSFVRLTGGLISELKAYLRSEGVADESQRDAFARGIIRGEDVGASAPQAQNVQRDFRLLQRTLQSLHLHLWGGGSGNHEIAAQSWEAESAGPSAQRRGLSDNVTGKFNRLVDQFTQARHQRPRSLIILAHDVDQENAEEVGRDVQAMESYAQRNGVRVEYYTLTDLYRIIRGRPPLQP